MHWDLKNVSAVQADELRMYLDRGYSTTGFARQDVEQWPMSQTTNGQTAPQSSSNASTNSHSLSIEIHPCSDTPSVDGRPSGNEYNTIVQGRYLVSFPCFVSSQDCIPSESVDSSFLNSFLQMALFESTIQGTYVIAR